MVEEVSQLGPIHIDAATLARRAELLDAPLTHARRIVQALPPRGRVKPPPDKPEAEMTNYERGWAIAYGWQRDVNKERPKRAAAWLLKGLVAFAVLLGILGALYAAFGPQKWMAIGGLFSAALWRAWWRARP